jgi:hypothetical protein
MMVRNWITKFANYFLRRIQEDISRARREIETAKHLTAKLLIEQTRQRGVLDNIHDAEFKVYSQWGDDGIIQYLINNMEIPVSSRTFVEFGVEHYVESNTRFLMMNNNWKGLVIDGSAANIEFIKRDEIYWRYGLTAVHAFIDVENINGLISDNGFFGEIGLLHIDIDGNDYWVWKALDRVRPILAIIEYNSVFGRNKAITVPYRSDFDRTKAHYSNLYFGASLKALCLLAREKGYRFVGSSSSGNNAFFVRDDKMGQLKELTVKEGYVESKARESRDMAGRLTFVSGGDRLKLIESLEVYDVESGRLAKLSEMR